MADKTGSLFSVSKNFPQDLMVPSYNPWTRLTLAVNPQDIVTWFELYGVDHHTVQFYRGLFK